MKKLIIAIAMMLALTACGTAPTKTVVVDQSGNVIETKEGFQGLVRIGDLPIANELDGSVYQDTRTGCEYASFGNKMFPYINADGQVNGCKNLKK